MSKKELQLKSKRLVISPMSDEELKLLIAETTTDELKQAYQEMLDGCLNDPQNRLWYTAWKINLKGSQERIGSAGFKGPAKKHSVEIGYGVDAGYEGKGYATEAVKAIIEWAFSQEDIYFIEAETDLDNIASKRVLKKLSFVQDGVGKEGPRFVLEKSEVSWLSIYICFGLSIGLAFGTSMDNTSLGICLGMGIGMCIGAALDSSEKQKRKKIREERKG